MEAAALPPARASVYAGSAMTTIDTISALAALAGVELIDQRPAAGGRGFPVDGFTPAAVVRPRTAEAVSAVLRLATERGLRVVPRGGGTMLDLGDSPAGVDLLLDLSALNRVLEHRPRDLTVTVEAGITFAELQRVLAAQGQIVALDPPLPEQATVGGAIAANATGPRRYRYGTARDLVIGATAVLADGSPIKSGGRVVKNVAGYDMNKLLTGSLGTLAVITSLTFRLFPEPPERGLVVAGFDSLAAAHGFAMQVFGGPLSPLSLDLVGPIPARDDDSTDHPPAGDGALSATGFFPKPEDEAHRRPPAGDGELSGTGVAAAELAELLLRAASSGWWLVCELGGTAAAVERSREELSMLARSAGAGSVSAFDAERGDGITGRLRDFGRAPESHASIILRAAVLPAQVALVMALIEASVPDGVPPPVLIARAGNGIVYAHWWELPLEELHRLVEMLRLELRPLDGLLTVERCPAEAKAGLDIWGIDGPDLELMRRVKLAYDPAGVLNPGRGPAG